MQRRLSRAACSAKLYVARYSRCLRSRKPASPPARFLTGRAQLLLSHPPFHSCLYTCLRILHLHTKIACQQRWPPTSQPKANFDCSHFQTNKGKRLAVVCIRNKQKGTSRRRGVLGGGEEGGKAFGLDWGRPPSLGQHRSNERARRDFGCSFVCSSAAVSPAAFAESRRASEQASALVC